MVADKNDTIANAYQKLLNKAENSRADLASDGADNDIGEKALRLQLSCASEIGITGNDDIIAFKVVFNVYS